MIERPYLTNLDEQIERIREELVDYEHQIMRMEANIKNTRAKARDLQKGLDKLVELKETYDDAQKQG
jgi:predicted  nucleic acid-binding Zn-ribbon protein